MAERRIEKNIENKLIEHFDKLFDKRTSDILKRRCGIGGYNPMTLREISEHYHISKERVRQIEGKAIRKYKHNLRIEMGYHNFINRLLSSSYSSSFG